MALQISITAIAKGRLANLSDALAYYAERLAPYVVVLYPLYASEQEMLETLDRQRGRVSPLLVLLDSRGKGHSSEAFAQWLQRERDGGRQSIVFAIGPASGWSEATRERADLLLCLGPMTLPHELARVVLTEQVYRAFTIMAGHPYHLGH